MNDFLSVLKKQRLYFDGGTGTLLEAEGLPAGTPPEVWNLEHRDIITSLHKAYLDAGANILKTNTFGVNCKKYENYETFIDAAFLAAKEAVDGRKNAFIAFDMGPTGRLLAPLGDLPFTEAVEIYAKNVRAAVKYSPDLILIETMGDCYETKAAVLAAKENADCPVFVTCAYDESGKMMTGANPRAMIAMLEGLGVDGIGMNCSFGPEEMLKLLPEFTEHASVPIIVNPNAGLPVVRNGKTVFTVDTATFADCMVKMAKGGATILGGCCGTTPDYIRETIRRTEKLPYSLPTFKNETVISSYTHTVSTKDSPILIGERLNPTGKPKLKEALRTHDLSFLVSEGLREADAGATVLDVNVGLPDLDETALLPEAVNALQSVTDLPLALDSADPDALAAAMRTYNGKPLVNSVNGTEESMQKIFPLLKKYGGVAVVLAISDAGIPATAEERAAVIRKVLRRAVKYGLSEKNFIADALTMAVSSDESSAETTLRTVRILTAEGIPTVLGISNISFGLPARDKINAAFFAEALASGLTAAIMNPFSVPMTDVYYAYRLLHGKDPAAESYIRYANENESEEKKPTAYTLKEAIVHGDKNEAETAAKKSIRTLSPLSVIEREIQPALAELGRKFEEQRIYLPQLLMGAEAASEAFRVVKSALPPKEAKDGREVILATVKGDIHDIGKNIVRVLLESHGFTVHDLGRDVPPEKVLTAVKETGCRLVGLSALMTTTVKAMEETVRLIKAESDASVIVGGAVITQSVADSVGADAYGETAMDTVHYAEVFYR